MTNRRLCTTCRVFIEADESYADHKLEWHTAYEDIAEPKNWWDDPEPWVPTGEGSIPKTTPIVHTWTEAEKLESDIAKDRDRCEWNRDRIERGQPPIYPNIPAATFLFLKSA